MRQRESSDFRLKKATSHQITDTFSLMSTCNELRPITNYQKYCTFYDISYNLGGLQLLVAGAY